MGWKGLGNPRWRQWVVEELVIKNGLTKVAEIGIYKGHLSQLLAKVPNLQHLLLVDSFSTDYWNQSRTKGQDRLDELYLYAVENFEGLENVELVRLPSAEAALGVNDGSLDMVFIDAGHTYECVRDDISYWHSKVKKGGILAGDDFWDKFPGVEKAVREVFDEVNLANDRTWWVRV